MRVIHVLWSSIETMLSYRRRQTRLLLFSKESSRRRRIVYSIAAALDCFVLSLADVNLSST